MPQDPEGSVPWLWYSFSSRRWPLQQSSSMRWGRLEMLAVAVLVAGGALVAGGPLGFLFGIPRALTRSEGAGDTGDTSRGYSPNTNLEDISDWLTKILVGVGLVQFTTLAGRVGELVDSLGPALGGGSLGESFAAATLVVFTSAASSPSLSSCTRLLPRPRIRAGGTSRRSSARSGRSSTTSRSRTSTALGS